MFAHRCHTPVQFALIDVYPIGALQGAASHLCKSLTLTREGLTLLMRSITAIRTSHWATLTDQEGGPCLVCCNAIAV